MNQSQLPKIEGKVWFNTKPLTQKDLEGKVVLIDFWTYSCINCIRTIPHLRTLWKKYKSYDFLIIGVHTPEFAFEKKKSNVEKAIKDLSITWPVVLDNDYVNWNNFTNRYWPAKYLADREGNVVYAHFGEGEHEKTEEAIQQVLLSSEKNLKLPQIEAPTPKGVCIRPSPEIYCGYERGRVVGGFIYDKPYRYRTPRALNLHAIALEGMFIATSEYIQSAAQSATIYLHFKGTEVNLVASAVSDSATVEILYLNEPLSDKLAGVDVDKSNSIIKEARMYNLLKSPTPLEGILNLKSLEGDFRVYAFTFSGCAE